MTATGLEPAPADASLVYDHHVPLLFGVAFFAVIVWLIAKAVKKNQQANIWALAGVGAAGPGGRRGRALVLQASRQSSLINTGGGRFESRSMTLDVEVPGHPPFQSSGTFRVPRGFVEAVPGASLEVSVDPNNPSNLEVLGPGGFSGPWIKYGPPNAY
jgi:hypothetical protein